MAILRENANVVASLFRPALLDFGMNSFLRFNLVVTPVVVGLKKERQTEHRTATTAYPCYLPVLGEFSRSWSCRFAEWQR